MRLRTYCLARREHTGSINSKKITMTNIVIRNKLKYAECFSDKSSFMKQKYNKNVVSKY